MNQDDDIWEQMDKDFEDYKKKMAERAYPEADDVEEDVRKMREASPHLPEELLWKLAVSYVAAMKRIKQWRRETVTEDLAEPMIKKLFSGNLECVDSLPPIPTLDEDEEVTEQRVRELEQHEENIAKSQPPPAKAKLEELASLVGELYDLREKKAETQLSPMEESIMQIGDQAMQDVLKDLESNQQPSKPLKRSRKPMNKRKILTVVAMVAFGAIILSHYTGWVSRQVKAGKWSEVTTWHRVGAEAYLDGKVLPGTTIKDGYFQYPTTTWHEHIGPECYRSNLRWVDPSNYKNPYADKVFIQDIRMPLFVLAVFYAGIFFILGDRKPRG